jgi:metal-dependent hydrolase (beta-lactamase superfamily II)
VIAISLQSGSNGNCIYVETNGVRLLFDAGISGIRAASRLEAYGRDIRRSMPCNSHDHADHQLCWCVSEKIWAAYLYYSGLCLKLKVKINSAS